MLQPQKKKEILIFHYSEKNTKIFVPLVSFRKNGVYLEPWLQVRLDNSV